MSIRLDALYCALDSDLGPVTETSFWPGMSTKDAAKVSLRKALTKKLVSTTSPDADSLAISKFTSSNNRCASWTLQLTDSWDEVLWGEFKNSIHRFFHRESTYPIWDHPYDMLKHARVGPGSAIGARGGDFYSKCFSSPLTATNSSLYFWYNRYIFNFPEWSSAEIIRRENFGEVVITSSSRTSCVPKTNVISRTICVEPSLNMMYQLGLAEILKERLRDQFGIDLTKQPFHNRELARKGSLFDSFSTIDLESASDSISLYFLEEVAPSWVVKDLKWLRSPQTRIGNNIVDLFMVSSQGNGFNTVLQTLLFTYD